MNIDIYETARLIGALMAIAGGVAGLMRWQKSCVEKAIALQVTPLEDRLRVQMHPIEERAREQFALMQERMRKQESWVRKQQEDIDAAHEYNIVITRGVMACLEGLREQGCNGPVTEGIEYIDTFLIKQANRGKSKPPKTNEEA